MEGEEEACPPGLVKLAQTCWTQESMVSGVGLGVFLRDRKDPSSLSKKDPPQTPCSPGSAATKSEGRASFPLTWRDLGWPSRTKLTHRKSKKQTHEATWYGTAEHDAGSARRNASLLFFCFTHVGAKSREWKGGGGWQINRKHGWAGGRLVLDAAKASVELLQNGIPWRI